MRRAARWIRRHLPGSVRPVILMYHRIAEPAFDPWGLSVSPANFADQLAALDAARRPMAMADFVAAARAGDIDPAAVGLTFDDGYADNLHRAKPALEAAGVPATIFLTTGCLGTAAEFWWDELARLIFAPAAWRGSVEVGGAPFAIDLPAVAVGADRHWRVGRPPRTARARTYLALWRALQATPPDARSAAMAALRAIAPASPVPPDDLPMAREDVRRLRSPLIDVGAHAVTHQPLTMRSREDQRAEIVDSRATCEALAEAAVTGFAYPHGDNDRGTRDLVQAAGFAWACTTRQSAVRPGAVDPYALPRLAVGDWTGERLLAEMRSIGR